MLKSIIAVTFFASILVFLDRPAAKACSGPHLSGFGKGSTLDEIIGGMTGACPSTITLNAGRRGFAVCESSMYGKTIFLIGSKRRVTAIRRGPNSYGKYCAW